MGVEEVRHQSFDSFFAVAHASRQDFNAAAEEAKTLPASVSSEDQARHKLNRFLIQTPRAPLFRLSVFLRPLQLALYGLFKQAKFGDNTTRAWRARPPPRAALQALFTCVYVASQRGPACST